MLMKREEIKMKTINHDLVTVLFTFKLGISLVKKTLYRENLFINISMNILV